MRFAICNEVFANWELARACAYIRQLGYEGVEFAPHTLTQDVFTWPAAARDKTRHVLEQSGLQTVGLHWLLVGQPGLHLTSPDPDVRRRTADYLVQLARLCRDLGGSLLVLGSPQQRRLLPDVSREDGQRFASDVVDRVLGALEANSITLAIEPLAPQECNFLSSAADAIAWIEQIGHPQVRLHLDARAMSYETRPIPQILADAARLLVHFHANDPNLLGPGMGDLDFAPILKALEDAGYGGWISVEVFATGPGPEQIACQSIHYLKGLGPWRAVR